MGTDRLGGIIAQRYEIEARIGAGGMGEVYRARDLTLGRSVAIKRLAPALAAEPRHRERLLQEARSAARLAHQGLAGLYDVLEEGDQFLLVMEYVEGDTLRQRLRDPVDPDEALDLMIDCAAALAHAHHAGIVHYDLKPANIMVTPEGRPKILDFGLAQIAAAAVDPDGSTLSFLTGSREIVGTPPYMAPEVLLGKKADARADLFSLGVVFYELLTGKNPFRASTPTATADLILHLDPPALRTVSPSIPARFQPIVGKLLAKNPRHRYATVDDLLVDLRAMAAAMTSPSMSGVYGEPAPATRPRWLAPAGAVVILAVAALAYLAATGPRPVAPAATAAAAVDADPRVFLAVLPVAADGSEAGPARVLHDGLASTLTSRLTQLTREHPFQMVAASSMRAIESIAEARLQFGVNRVLTFMLLQQGDRVRANLELVDATTGVQLDADSVDGAASNLLEFQDHVSDRILRMLRIQLRPQEREMMRAGTESRSAYGYFVSGIGFMEMATLDDLQLAVDQFRNALRADDRFVAAHAALGQAFLYLWEFTEEPTWLDRAGEACADAVEIDDLDARALACQGSVALEQGRTDEAIRALEASHDSDPTSQTTVRSLASAYRAGGREGAAEDLYLRLIDELPHHSVPHGWLAGLYLRQGRFDEARDHYERNVELSPDAWRALNGLGAAEFYLGHWTAAKRAWQRGHELNPQDAPIRNNLAIAQFYDGSFDEAADTFRLAVDEAPGRFVFWGNYAEALWHADGRRDEALEAYRRAADLALAQVERNGADAGARASLGLYQAMLGERAESAEQFRRAHELAPEDQEVHYKAAKAAVVEGRLDDALADLQRATRFGASPVITAAEPLFAALRQHPDWEAVAGGPQEPTPEESPQ